jgi:hypothetical protein
LKANNEIEKNERNKEKNKENRKNSEKDSLLHQYLHGYSNGFFILPRKINYLFLDASGGVLAIEQGSSLV